MRIIGEYLYFQSATPNKEDIMASIEIHGYTISKSRGLKKALEAMGKIENALQHFDTKDIFVDVISSRTHSCNKPRKRQPFLRICSANPKEANKIAEALHTAIPQIDIDIEALVVSRFIPRDK